MQGAQNNERAPLLNEQHLESFELCHVSLKRGEDIHHRTGWSAAAVQEDSEEAAVQEGGDTPSGSGPGVSKYGALKRGEDYRTSPSPVRNRKDGDVTSPSPVRNRKDGDVKRSVGEEETECEEGKSSPAEPEKQYSSATNSHSDEEKP